jgi:hypothetical protein
MAKINYHIHTDAVKQNLIPKELSPAQTSITDAHEADVLNVALFGMILLVLINRVRFQIAEEIVFLIQIAGYDFRNCHRE